MSALHNQLKTSGSSPVASQGQLAPEAPVERIPVLRSGHPRLDAHLAAAPQAQHVLVGADHGVRSPGCNKPFIAESCQIMVYS